MQPDTASIEQHQQTKLQDSQAQGPNVNAVQSYYADKDLAWWLQLARDFKSARQVPLPLEDGDDNI